jgi:hypothetical protein
MVPRCRGSTFHVEHAPSWPGHAATRWRLVAASGGRRSGAAPTADRLGRRSGARAAPPRRAVSRTWRSPSSRSFPVAAGRGDIAQVPCDDRGRHGVLCGPAAPPLCIASRGRGLVRRAGRLRLGPSRRPSAAVRRASRRRAAVPPFHVKPAAVPHVTRSRVTSPNVLIPRRAAVPWTPRQRALPRGTSRAQPQSEPAPPPRSEPLRPRDASPSDPHAKRAPPTPREASCTQLARSDLLLAHAK